MRFTPRCAVPLLVAFIRLSAAPAGETPILKSEFIFESAPFPACHASTIVEIAPGHLVAAWFGGTAERNPDVGIWVSRQDNGSWTPPVEVANGVQMTGPRVPAWNPVLFQPRTGPLLLFYKLGPEPRRWWGMITTSADGGKTWALSRRLPDGILGPIKNKPVQLPDGSLLAPSSTESEDAGWQVHFERSTDLGLTWTATSPVNSKAEFNAIQPSILFHPHGRLEAVGRSKNDAIFQTWSEDNGRTWSKLAATNLPNPSSGTDAVTLADGRQLIVYNHTPKGRTPLNVALSRDGSTWQSVLVLENEPGEYSYPAVIQTSDGLVHITYTWQRRRIKHVVLDPAETLTRRDVRMKKPDVSSGYKWGVVGMLWWVCFFNYADRQAIFSVFPKLKEEFGFDAVQLGLIGSAFAWMYAFGAPIAGFIADRCSRKRLILGGCLFWSVVTMTTGWCTRLWQFVAVRALEGAGETFYFPATMSLLSDYHGRRTRSRAFALHQSSVYAGTILGSWLGAWLAERYGWRAGFYFFGGAGIVLALVLARFLREPVRGGPETGETSTVAEPALGVREAAREIFRQPIALLLLVVFLGANFVATIFLTWTPTFLVEKFGFKLTAAGLSGSVFIHLASAVSVPLGGWLADRLARRWTGGRILVQATGLLVGASFIALVGLTRDVSTLLVAMTCFGLCKGLYDANIFASLYDVIAPRARATAAGIMNTVGWSGGALGPLAVGLATKYGRHAEAIDNMSEAIAFGSLIYLVGAVLLVIAMFRIGRRPASPGC